jgi:hypothetical protein
MNPEPEATGTPSQYRSPTIGGNGPSFLAAYCAQEKIAPSEFVPAVFERILMQRKRFLAKMARKLDPKFFAEDEQLIKVCGEKHSMTEVKREISEYFADRHYWGFWRGKVDIRISTERLRLTAEQYLEPKR